MRATTAAALGLMLLLSPPVRAEQSSAASLFHRAGELFIAEQSGVPAFISEIDHLTRPANLAAEAGGLIQVADRP
jgi:hypothetical protein